MLEYIKCLEMLKLDAENILVEIQMRKSFVKDDKLRRTKIDK